jgi:hypothetical protein
MFIDKHFTRHTDEPTPVNGNLSPEGLSDCKGWWSQAHVSRAANDHSAMFH